MDDRSFDPDVADLAAQDLDELGRQALRGRPVEGSVVRAAAALFRSALAEIDRLRARLAEVERMLAKEERHG